MFQNLHSPEVPLTAHGWEGGEGVFGGEGGLNWLLAY